MSVITLTKDNFDSTLKSNPIVLVDFWAAWCGPCRMLSPIVDEIANDGGDFAVGKVNVDEQSELAEKFNISTIPTLIVFKNGKPVEKSVGVKTKSAILQMLK